MYAFDHFGTNKGTLRHNAIERNELAEVLSLEGARIHMMVAKGALEAYIEDCVIGDVGVLWGVEGKGGFLESTVKRGEVVGGLVEDATVRNLHESITHCIVLYCTCGGRRGRQLTFLPFCPAYS